MAQRYKVTKKRGQQGNVQCFEGTDTLNGLPVYVYQFEGRPLPKSDKLYSNNIPDILSVRTDNNRSQVIASMLPSFKPVETLSSPEACEQVMIDTAQALADAAQIGLRHGDIHKGRILSDGESFKLEGYGVAWSPDGITHPAPEGDVGIVADAYAWAKTMQGLLGANLSDIAPSMRNLLERCLQPDPAQRPSGEAILDALHNASFEVSALPSDAEPADPSPTSSATSTPAASPTPSASSDTPMPSATPAATSDPFSSFFEAGEHPRPAATPSSAPAAASLDFSGFAMEDEPTDAAGTEPRDSQQDSYEQLFAEQIPEEAPSTPNKAAPAADSFATLMNAGSSLDDEDDGFAIELDDDIAQPAEVHTPPPAVVAMPLPQAAQAETAQERAERKKMQTTFVKGPPPGSTVKVGKDNTREKQSKKEPYFQEEDIAKGSGLSGSIGGVALAKLVPWLLGGLAALALLGAGIYFLPRMREPLPPVNINYVLGVSLQPQAETEPPRSAVGLFVVSSPQGSSRQPNDRLALLGPEVSIVTFDSAGKWRVQARALNGSAKSTVLTFEIPEGGFSSYSTLSPIALKSNQATND